MALEPSPPREIPALPVEPSAVKPLGKWLVWGLIAVFVLCFVGGYVSASDHLIQQRACEIEGHLALICLGLTLVARPLDGRIPGLLSQRRALGLLAFAFTIQHTWNTIVHVLGGTLDGMFFLPIDMQVGVTLGVFSLLIMVPLALTSNNLSVRLLKKTWKSLHLGVFYAAALAVLHTLGTGVHYLVVAQAPLQIACTCLLVGGVLWVWNAREAQTEKKEKEL
jgi:methionine sulfoxide reductase heme-binding subunit